MFALQSLQLRMHSDAMTKKIAYDKVCMVIDLDGFNVNGEFIARVLGYAALTANESGVYRFDPRIYMKTLSDKDKKTAGYCAYQIHGMFCILDVDEPTCKITNLEKIMTMLYDKCRHPVRDVVGYKGGHIEQDLLVILGIPSVNVEDLDCPRFENIAATTFTEVSDNCGFHKHYKGHGFPHCARQEAEVFREWLKKTYTIGDVSDSFVSEMNSDEYVLDCDKYVKHHGVELADVLKIYPCKKRDVDGNFKM